MAVWPDPTHGTCSYVHFKILMSGKSDRLEKQTLVFTVFLAMILELVLWKRSYGPWDHCSFSANSVMQLVFYRSDSACSRKYGFTDYCIFAKLHHAQGVSQPCASASQLPAALRRPQKDTPLDFWNMYFVDFVVFCDFELSWGTLGSKAHEEVVVLLEVVDGL